MYTYVEYVPFSLSSVAVSRKLSAIQFLLCGSASFCSCFHAWHPLHHSSRENSAAQGATLSARICKLVLTLMPDECMSVFVRVHVCLSPGLLFLTLTYLCGVQLRSRLTDGPATHTAHIHTHIPFILVPFFAYLWFSISSFSFNTVFLPFIFKFNHSVITSL